VPDSPFIVRDPEVIVPDSPFIVRDPEVIVPSLKAFVRSPILPLTPLPLFLPPNQHFAALARTTSGFPLSVRFALAIPRREEGKQHNSAESLHRSSPSDEEN
jgi:hypothetical protein